MTEMDDTTKEMIAVGIAGFAMSMELLTTLNKLGGVSDRTLIDVVDGALNGVETVDSDGHEIYRLARRLLGGHLADFRDGLKGEPGPDIPAP